MSQLDNIKDEGLRARLKDLSTMDMRDGRADELSQHLAGIAVTEIAEFSEVGRSLRTASGRAMLLDPTSDEQATRVNAGAQALTRAVNNAASTNDDGWLGKDNSGLAVHTSKRKMAEAIFKDKDARRKYKSVDAVEKDLPAIMAASYKNKNVRKMLGKTFEAAETALGLIGGDTEYTRSTQEIYSQADGHYSSGVAINRKSISLGEFALGVDTEDNLDSDKMVEDKAVSLVNAVKNVVKKNMGLKEPGVAQELISDYVYEFIQFATKGNYESDDDAIEAFLRQNKKFSSILGSLDQEHRDTIKNFMKQQYNTADISETVGTSRMRKTEYNDIFAKFMKSGTRVLKEGALKDFVKDSDTVAKLFGKGKTTETYVGRVKQLFGKLGDENFKFGTGAISESGEVDIENILKAMGFDKSEMSEKDYDELYNMASSTFGSGDLGKANQKKFGDQIIKQINQGKMKTVGGVGGKDTHSAAIQSAIDSMAILQSATASLLTALATGKQSDLDKVATKLKSIQSAPKVPR